MTQNRQYPPMPLPHYFCLLIGLPYKQINTNASLLSFLTFFIALLI